MTHSKQVKPTDTGILLASGQLDAFAPLIEILVQAGCKVQTAADGELALRGALAGPPALVLLDVRLPVLDGYEVCRRLKADSRTSSIPVIFITCLEQPGDKMAGGEAGAVGCITNPFVREDVLAQVAVQLERYRSSRQLRETNGLSGAGIEQQQAESTLQQRERQVPDLLEEPERTRQVLAGMLMEQQRTAAALQRAHENLSLALRAGQAGIWDWDMAENRYYWSPEFLAIFGMPADVSPGFESWTQVVHPADREMAASNIRRAVETRTELFNDYRIVWPGGEIRWIRAVGKTFYEGDRPVRMTGLCQDITVMKRSEEAIRLSEQKFARIFAEAPLLMALSSLEDGTYLDVNRKFLEMSGFTREEVIGHSSTGLGIMPPDVRAALLDELKARGHIRNREVAVTGKNGRSFPCSLTGEVLELDGRAVLLSIGEDISRRRQVEENLGAERRRLQNAAMAGHIALWEWDLAAGLLSWSDVIDPMLGFGVQEFPRTIQAWEDILHPDDRSRVLSALERHFQQGEPYRIDYRVRKSDGSYLWWHVVGSAERDGQGRPVRMAGACADITDQKKSARVQQQLAEQYRVLTGTSMDGYWVTDDSGRLLDVNDAYCRMTGYSRDELFRMTAADLDLTEDPAATKAHAARVLAAGSDRFEARHRCKDGRIIDLEINATGIPAENRLLVFLRDITARKQNEEALRFQAAVLDQISDMITVTDMEGNITWINRAESRMLKRSKAELVGRPVSDYGEDPAHGATQAEILAVTLREGAWSGEVTNFDKEGNARTISCRTFMVKDDQGRAVALCGLGTDITESKRTEKALRDSEARYRAFFEQGPDGVVILDPLTGRIVEFNDQACRQLGYTREEFARLHVADIDVIETKEDVRQRIQHVLQCGRDDFDTRHRTKQGEIREVHVTAQIVESSAQPIYHCIWRDITARKRTEEALRASEERYQTFIRQSAEGIYRMEINPPIDITLPVQTQLELLAERTVLAECNGRLADMYGFDSADAISGKFMHELYSGKEIMINRPGLRSFIESGYRLTDHESPERTTGGKEKYFSSSAVGIIENGQLIRVWGSQLDITERRRTEQVLRESEERMRVIVEGTPQLFFYTQDADASNTYVSPTVERITGYPPEVWLRQSDWFCTDHPLNRLAKERTLANLRGDFAPGPILLEVRHAAGHPVRLEVYEAPVWRNGKVVGLQGVAHDISERCRAEEALQISEEMHRALIENIPDVVMRFDRAGRHLFVSGNVSQVVDLQAWQFFGKTHRELGFPEDRCEFWEESIREVFDSGNPMESEYSFEGKHGLMIHHWRLVPERDARGVVQSVLSLSRDITAHRRAEQNYRMLFREMMDGFALHEIICDESGRPVDYRFLAVNPAFERMTGLRADGITGRRVREVMPDIEPAWIETYGKVALTGEPALFEQFAAGLNKYFEVTAFRPSAGRFACIFTDITERRRAGEEREKLQTQLNQAQKMESVGRLAGGVAHDFNNMLGVILGHAEMALEQVSPDQPIYADLEQIRNAASRSADLTRQLLAFARKQTVTPKVLDLNDTVAGMLKMLQRLIGESIELQWQPAAGLWTVRVDPSQIDQILANLCVNARDAIAGVGRIMIRTDNCSFDAGYCASHPGFIAGEYVQLTVGDNGCGMDPATLAHLFEPFFTTKSAGVGTGLGLATVYGAVRQNNGFIDVWSEPGQGTAISIFLPRHKDPAEQAESVKPAGLAGRGHETILLVEDEPAILKMTALMLKRQGYVVLAARTPGEALRMAREHPGGIDLLMTDVVMPEMNGRELAKALISICPGVKRVFMSGYTADIIAHHGVLEAGVNFLLKPFTITELSAKIRAVLDGE